MYTDGPLMSLKTNGFWSTTLLVALAAGLSAQTPAQTPAQPPATATATQQNPTFRVQVDLVTNDIVGIVSSGPSSIAVDMTYDKARLQESIKKIAGSELKPTDIINGSSGAEGPSEVRYRAHVAFSTVNDLLNNLESVHNRRKALVYVSDGYDFNPFQDARLGLMDPNSPFAQNEFARSQNQAQNANGTGGGTDPFTSQQKQSETFADAD